ncbi:hypothetical protein BpHYR1_029421 [Brachionus plicatilis]|uniref:Uncharacterized protein n=1 Tax=Brachionus plicatilis TaxID=10195 RepID=A0A3M7PQ10_BRAPC|nr:hypothetical protein BpHYR1_029421 [Brachionus plicatilis]
MDGRGGGDGTMNTLNNSCFLTVFRSDLEEVIIGERESIFFFGVSKSKTLNRLMTRGVFLSIGLGGDDGSSLTIMDDNESSLSNTQLLGGDFRIIIVAFEEEELEEYSLEWEVVSFSEIMFWYKGSLGLGRRGAVR